MQDDVEKLRRQQHERAKRESEKLKLLEKAEEYFNNIEVLLLDFREDRVPRVALSPQYENSKFPITPALNSGEAKELAAFAEKVIERWLEEQGLAPTLAESLSNN